MMVAWPARARPLVLAAGLALSALVTSCGGGKAPAAKPAFDTTRPHWSDAFDRVPDIAVLVHPTAMAKDPVFGPLLKSITRMIASRTPMTAGTRTAEVLESCDEVIFGLRDTRGGDAVIVFRGVRADFDARKLVDGNGRPMWTDGPRAPVTELTRAATADASLFVLPDRTWVVAVGDARARAREAFAHPFDRPPPLRDDASLVMVRLEGPPLVESVPRLRTKGAALEPLGRKLSAITVKLRPGKEGVVATFAYDEEDAAAFAEVRLREIVQELGTRGSDKTKWLGEAKVDRQAATIVAKVAIPSKLLEDLPTVNQGDLGF